MKMKGISPLLAAVILVALTISVAFIVSSAISGMAQKQASAASETAQASGALLQVDLDSLTCTNESANNATLEMVLRLTGTTKSATGLTVVMKDSGGNLLSSYNPTATINPGVNVFTIHFNNNATEGEISYLAVSTENPSIHISYDSETYGSIVKCQR